MARKRRTPTWRLALLLGALAPGAEPAQAAPQPPPVMAVAEFDYSDTSGEPTDQAARHLELLRGLAAGLRSALGASGHYEVVPLPCRTEPIGCAEVAVLLARAREAGASLLLIGGVHKLSTLVQFARVQAMDVRDGMSVFDKLYTFRGDTSEAWRHAEAFMAADVMRGVDQAMP